MLDARLRVSRAVNAMAMIERCARHQDVDMPMQTIREMVQNREAPDSPNGLAMDRSAGVVEGYVPLEEAAAW